MHPHLKNFIRSVVVSEMSTTHSKDYHWKELAMREVQEHVLSSLENIQTRDDLNSVIDSKILELRKSLNQTLDMIANTLKQVPIEVLRKLNKK